ncbi:uncharacterized protein [Ptychodera flava]|uniref:uncharacterized protein n=1 Tax=Ptychodera flava TaxID=63121 RepID=UPI003969BD25
MPIVFRDFLPLLKTKYFDRVSGHTMGYRGMTLQDGANFKTISPRNRFQPSSPYAGLVNSYTMSGLEFHRSVIETRCRFCFGNLNRSGSRKYSVQDYVSDVQCIFHIDVSLDEHEIHPQQFCGNCKRKLLHGKEAALHQKHYDICENFAEWSKHPRNGDCKVCNKLLTCKKGGRTPKRRQSFNKYSNLQKLPPTDTSADKSMESATTCELETEVIISKINNEKAASFLSPENDISLHPEIFEDTISSEFLCPICKEVLDAPVQIVCGHVFCGECLCEWVLAATTVINCPICRFEMKSSSCIIKVAIPFTTCLGEKLLTCKSCQDTLPLSQLKSHEHCTSVQSSQKHSEAVIPLSEPEHAVSVLLRPEVSLATIPGYEDLATKCIKEKLESTPNARAGAPVRFKTGGPPLYVQCISKPRKDSSAVTTKTKSNRVKLIQRLRDQLSGGKSGVQEQLTHELKSLSKTERAAVLSNLGLLPDMKEGDGLSLKVDMRLTWYQFRKLKQWLRKWKLSLRSEAEDRKEFATLTPPIYTEHLPFMFTIKTSTGKQASEIRLAPLAGCDILHLVEEHLSANERLCRLTWHEGSIPEDIIQVKIGGDKGGGSMKFAFEICNLDHPNAKENTVVWLMFEASDNHHNLKLALENYANSINTLNGYKWKQYTIESILCGDYEYQTKLYGLSGAAGKHFCLWCNITKENSQKPLAERGRQTPRTLESIKAAYSRFVSNGSKLKDASKFMNCIHQPLIEIPIDQVCPPALHLSLGIFLKLFNLMESYCIPLDVQMYVRLHQDNSSGSSNSTPPSNKPVEYDTYLSIACEIAALKDAMRRIEVEVQEIESSMMSTLLHDHQYTASMQCTEDVTGLQVARDTKQKELLKLETEINTKEKALPKEAGFVNRAIDNCLQTLHVKRQAYHGRSFIGNHVDICLKPKNISSICSSIVSCTEVLCPDLLDRAHDIRDTFEPLFLKFSRCHGVYSVIRPLSQSEIIQFGKSVEDFLSYFRSKFPRETVTPKMHILEDHVVPWIQMHGVGCGLHGEQGMEGIHSVFNQLTATYSRIPQKLDQLQQLMNMHHLSVHPVKTCDKPEIKKRKLKSRE